MKSFIAGLAALTLFGCNESRNKSIELMNSGVAKFHNRLFESAERDLQAAIQTDPSNVLAHYNLGKVYEEQHKWTEASDEFARAVTGDDSNAKDRKSTRLNSSHLGISYAVFCLKKK